MPLIKSASPEAMDENVSELLNAGHPEKQAVAIAYKLKRRVSGAAPKNLKRPTLHHTHPFNSPNAPDNRKKA